MSTKFKSFLSEKGIQHILSNPYTPQQNGVAEQKERTLKKAMLCLLKDARLPFKFWAEVINTACYVQNRLFNSVIKDTPFHQFYGVKPKVSHLRIFGSTAWVHISKQLRQKGASKTKKAIFVGYEQSQRSYRFILGDQLIISKSASFAIRRAAG